MPRYDLDETGTLTIVSENTVPEIEGLPYVLAALKKLFVTSITLLLVGAIFYPFIVETLATSGVNLAGIPIPVTDAQLAEAKESANLSGEPLEEISEDIVTPYSVFRQIDNGQFSESYGEGTIDVFVNKIENRQYGYLMDRISANLAETIHLKVNSFESSLDSSLREFIETDKQSTAGGTESVAPKEPGESATDVPQ